MALAGSGTRRPASCGEATAAADIALLDRWRSGDQAAGHALLARHFPSLYRFFANKCEEPDELVQATFLACVRARDQFRKGASFRTYLFVIARHELYRFLRARRSDRERIDFSVTSVAELVTTPGTRLDRDQARRQVAAALRELPVEQQSLLELYYWEELEVAELAEIFGAPPATIRTWLFRARAALRSRLAERGEVCDLDDRPKRQRAT